MKPITILIVDDHQLFREGMKLILLNLPYVTEVFEAADGKSLKSFLKEGLKPEIVFMDIEMPEMNGIEATKSAIREYPWLNIIGLSMYSDENYYTSMIEAGAKGFILKNSNIQEVESAIHHILAGKNYFSQEIMGHFILQLNRKPNAEEQGKLSEREEEILFLICKGLSNLEIAERLSISKRTVDKHRENILFKTGSKNTAGLVMFAIKQGIVEI